MKRIFFLIYIICVVSSISAKIIDEDKTLDIYTTDSIIKADPSSFAWREVYKDKFCTLRISEEKKDSLNIYTITTGNTHLYGQLGSSVMKSLKIIQSDKNSIIYQYIIPSRNDGPYSWSLYEGQIIFHNGKFLYRDEDMTIWKGDDNPSFQQTDVNYWKIGDEIYKTSIVTQNCIYPPYSIIEKYNALHNNYDKIVNESTNIKSYKVENYEAEKAFCTVSENRIRLRNGPALNSKILGLINQSDKFQIIGIYPIVQTIDGVNDYWIKIKLSDKEGYIWGEYILREN